VRLTVSVEVVVVEVMYNRCHSGKEEVALVALSLLEDMARPRGDSAQHYWIGMTHSSLLSPGLHLRHDPTCSFHTG